MTNLATISGLVSASLLFTMAIQSPAQAQKVRSCNGEQPMIVVLRPQGPFDIPLRVYGWIDISNNLGATVSAATEGAIPVGKRYQIIQGRNYIVRNNNLTVGNSCNSDNKGGSGRWKKKWPIQNGCIYANGLSICLNKKH